MNKKKKEKIDRIIELIKEGVPYKEIAKRVGTSHGYVKLIASTFKKLNGNGQAQEKEEDPKREIEIEREKIKRQIAEKKYLQLKRTLARDENIIQALKEVIPQFPVPEFVNPPKPTYTKGKETAVLLISD
ncbi:MAG: hypothetical protein DSY42_04505 [Aquifex sp.]|nr:MAG: hypothetical protein DSY42_04505 [Aquifex sp.]